MNTSTTASKGSWLQVPVAEITVPAGRRPIDAEHVARLVASMSGGNLIQNIAVTEDRVLVHGAHRLQAAKELRWKTIAADVWTGSSMALRVIELDENISKPLPVAERAQLLAEAKALYLAEHPETARGGKRPGAGRKPAGGNQTPDSGLRFDAGDQAPSFVTAMAAKTGRSESAIKADVALGERLTPAALKAVQGTPLVDNAAALARVAASSAEETQVDAVQGELSKLAEPKKPRKPIAPRVDHGARAAEVARLHGEGHGTIEIGRRMGIEPTTVSKLKGDLGIANNSPPVKLWSGVERVATVLAGAAIHAEKLANDLDIEEVAFDEEELRKCVKNLSEAIGIHRKLLAALKRRLR